jgi:hypothetical protein
MGCSGKMTTCPGLARRLVHAASHIASAPRPEPHNTHYLPSDRTSQHSLCRRVLVGGDRAVVSLLALQYHLAIRDVQIGKQATA